MFKSGRLAARRPWRGKLFAAHLLFRLAALGANSYLISRIPTFHPAQDWVAATQLLYWSTAVFHSLVELTKHRHIEESNHLTSVRSRFGSRVLRLRDHVFYVSLTNTLMTYSFLVFFLPNTPVLNTVDFYEFLGLFLAIVLEMFVTYHVSRGGVWMDAMLCSVFGCVATLFGLDFVAHFESPGHSYTASQVVILVVLSMVVAGGYFAIARLVLICFRDRFWNKLRCWFVYGKQGVTVAWNVVYRTGEGSHTRNTLDIFVRRNRISQPMLATSSMLGMPVVIFVHGGLYRFGNKSWCEHIGYEFALHGVVCVTVNYRTNSLLRHIIEDLPHAVAWARTHIEEYGGSPDRMFLVGHSSGAHGVTMLAVDPSYLAGVGLSPSLLKGIVPISNSKLLINDKCVLGCCCRLYGEGEYSGDAVSPFHFFRREGGPISLPPFLLCWALTEARVYQRVGRQMVFLLDSCGASVETLVIRDESHVSEVMRIGGYDDVLVPGILEFVFQNSE